MAIERLFGTHAAILRDRPLQLLFGANAFIVLSIALVSPILESLTGPFDVSHAEIGLFVTAVAFPAIFLLPISGVISDRLGRKPLLAGGLIIFGLSGASISLVTDFRIGLGLRFLQGIGLSATLPTIVSSMRDLYSDAEEATAQGLRVGVTGVSQAILSTVAGFLVVMAWQYPFLLYLGAVPVGVAVLVLFREPLDSSADNTEIPGSLSQYAKDISEVLVHQRVVMILFAQTLNFFLLFTFYTYNSLVIDGVVGQGPREAGLIVGVFSLVFAGLATQVGRITGYFSNRAKPLLLAHFSASIGLIVFATSPNIYLAGVGAILIASGVAITAPMYRSLMSGFAPQEIRGGMVSVGESLGWASVTAAPVIVGIAISGLTPRLGYSLALQVVLVIVGAGTGIASIAAILIANRSPRTPGELSLA